MQLKHLPIVQADDLDTLRQRLLIRETLFTARLAAESWALVYATRTRPPSLSDWLSFLSGHSALPMGRLPIRSLVQEQRWQLPCVMAETPSDAI